MVCDRCETKLAKVVVPDKWKTGARNTTGGKDGGRSVGGNKLLERKGKVRSNRYNPLAERTCRICKVKVGENAHYCTSCAYKKGICTMCGRKVVDKKEYKMSKMSG